MSSHLDDNIIPPSRQREAPRKDLKWIGQNMKRVEDPRLLTGKGKYIDDLSLPNMAEAAVLRSPHAHARIVSIDISRAAALPGVVAVVTGKDMATVTGPCASFASPPITQHCMAIDKVRHVGEAVAAVVAEDRYIAEDAVELIEVRYEPLPVNASAETAIKASGDGLIHPTERPTNVALDETYAWGPVEEDFAKADVVIRRQLTWGRSSGTPIETCGAVAQYEDGIGYTVHSNSSMGNFIPWVLADSLKVNPTQVKFIGVTGGGSFGSKVFLHKIIILTGGLARLAGRPVKYIEDRLEHFLNSDGHGPNRIYDAELALKKDGTMLSLRFKVIDDYGAYLQFGVGTHGNPMSQVTGPYRINSVGMHLMAVLTNKCQQGPYRCFGAECANWMLERLVDAAAQEMKIDREVLRTKNMITPDQFPYMIPTGNIYDSGDYHAVLADAKKLIDLDGWKKEQTQARTQGRYIGIGLATCQERSVYSPTEWWSLNPQATPGFALTSAPEGIQLRIDGSGHIFAQLQTPFIGTSSETMVTQVLAEQFGLTPADISIGYSDSQTGFNGIGANGSRFTVMVTGACVSASLKLKERLKRFGAEMIEASMNDVEVRDGAVSVVGAPDMRKTIGEVALMANFFRKNFPDDPAFDSGLETTAVYDHPLNTLPHPQRKHLGIFYPIMGHQCHIAVVEVDAATGKVAILDYAAVHDAGTMVNPKTLGGQVAGGTANGIGTVLMEEFIYDEQGQFVNANFAQCCLPSAHDIPTIRMGHRETPSPYTEYGIKGGGEGGRMAAPAAMVSAIEDALRPLDVEILSVPMTPPRLRALIREAQAAQH
jgi:CO/xanthine dehydrogenase Mo-binding subunit